ncbi:butanoate--CoA ligase AAE1 isoform X2 [Lactuca sativa]|uniref:butanoate--CoA ligase AAE1 isoform X2 n=1 Tax=Lactuca sativa TaxID=4236 RepID=UPI001C691B55|nr:butanoate--CoA ligase AAE1 isoform X2 [Lactuca sativa]
MEGLAGLKLRTLNYNVFDEFRALLHKDTTITMNMIMKSNTRLYRGSHKTAKHYSKFRCESSAKSSLLAGTMEELQHESWKPLKGIVLCSANYVPLTPISFLDRAALVYSKRISIIYGSIKYTWEETHRRCMKLASALNNFGVSRGDVVATLAPNVPAMLELHFAIPMAGATICPFDIRLDPNMLSTLLNHSKPKILFVDYQLQQIATEAVNLLKNTHSKAPLIIVISEPNYRRPFKHIRKHDYESFLEDGVAEFSIVRPHHECDPISLNYTYGTTSSPEGVICSHRGAYLTSLSSMFIHGMIEMPTYLWTLPMFQCNGWSFTWGLAIVGGTNVCLRSVTPKEIFDNIVIHNVSHYMCGAPTITKATKEAFEGGWNRSGDLPIEHRNGGIQVMDHSNNIVISGGENISMIQVETVIYSHPAVLEVEVVAKPDEHWGQTPCAFVKLKEGVHVDANEIIDYFRDRIPHYMAPMTVIFEDLPRNLSAKVQKFLLKEKAKNLGGTFFLPKTRPS